MTTADGAPFQPGFEKSIELMAQHSYYAKRARAYGTLLMTAIIINAVSATVGWVTIVFWLLLGSALVTGGLTGYYLAKVNNALRAFERHIVNVHDL